MMLSTSVKSISADFISEKTYVIINEGTAETQTFFCYHLYFVNKKDCTNVLGNCVFISSL